jgi:nitrite reductase/ring-hydroxylating ferredoxin subunit
VGIDEPLPAEFYAQPEAFQRERRSVFRGAWLLLARVGALQNPGDYVAQSLGGWPVFAIVDPTGAPKAFRNVCRHQKLPLFDTGAGHCEQIRCRYHGWTYDTAGRFRSAPPPVAPSGALSSNLEPLAAERLHGLLFVHLDDDPPALAASAPDLAAALTAAALETHGFQSETATDINANWKLVIEQALADCRGGVARKLAWPCLILETGDDGAVIHQVIARSFHRTRIHHHCYGAATSAEQAISRAAEWKTSALARQAALEAGGVAPLPVSTELEGFRGRLRAAHADGLPS